MGIDSRDGGYVDIAETDLQRVQLEHLASAIDMSISLPEALVASGDVITGYTEWIGRWQHRGLSIGWDWAFVNKGILLIHAEAIRSNIRIIGTDGVPATAAHMRAHLAAWLETLPWRDGAVSQLVRRNRRPAS
jgi:hypothetical protein